MKIWQKQQENLTLYHLQKSQITMENALEIKILPYRGMLEVFINNINAISYLKLHFFKDFLRYIFSNEILHVFLFSKTNTLFWFIFTWFFAIFLHLKTKILRLRLIKIAFFL